MNSATIEGLGIKGDTVNRVTSDTVQYVDPDGIHPGNGEFSERERLALDVINRKVAAAQSLDEVMEFLFESTQAICPCDRIGVAFVEEEGKRIVSRWARALYAPLLLDRGYTEDLPGNSLGTVLDSDKLRIINDLEQYLAVHPRSASTGLLVREGVRSSMTCPLRIDAGPGKPGRVVGLLFRSSRKRSAYNEHQALLHHAVGERLSQAIEKAWRIEALTAANHAYSEMLGFVSHELKSPLASIVMSANVLIGEYAGEITPPQRAKVEQIARKAEYLLNLVRGYLDLARVESGELTLDARPDVDFSSEIVKPSIEMVASDSEQKGMRIAREGVHEIGLVECDPILMKIVVANLVGNAVKYGNDGGLIRLTVRRNRAGLSLSVWNEGPGFPDSERPRLFRRFSRLQTPELLKHKGSGVGLYTTWRIVQLHGGRLSAKSEVGRWAEFSFVIPQPLGSGHENPIHH